MDLALNNLQRLICHKTKPIIPSPQRLERERNKYEKLCKKIPCIQFLIFAPHR